MTPIELKGLRPQTYEHPQDRAALTALEKTAGVGSVIAKLNEMGVDKTLRIQLTGQHLRVTADSLPDLYNTLLTACRTLDHRVVPDLYIVGGHEINAFTSCVERPLIAVTSGAVTHLSPKELLFVVGHEVGHIKSRHVLYYQIADKILPIAGELAGAIPLFGDVLKILLMSGGGAAFLHWMRMSEFTADRAGLLACQDADVAFATMAKLAGLPSKYYATYNTADFIQQAREFDAMDIDWSSKLAKVMAGLWASHPWTVLRAQELLKWIEAGNYQHVISNPVSLPEMPFGSHKANCTASGRPLVGNEKFCGQCGARIA